MKKEIVKLVKEKTEVQQENVRVSEENNDLKLREMVMKKEMQNETKLVRKLEKNVEDLTTQNETIAGRFDESKLLVSRLEKRVQNLTTQLEGTQSQLERTKLQLETIYQYNGSRTVTVSSF